jgi:hypothetical protein
VHTQVLAGLIYALALACPSQAAEQVCEAEDAVCLLAREQGRG